MRDEQAKKAAAAAYHESRRVYRPKIMQVPSVGRRPGTMRSILVPAPRKPITWAQAREVGRATVRVLEGLPANPEPAEREKMAKIATRITASRKARAAAKKAGKLPMKVRRDPKGEWWATRFADLVERRRASAEAKAKPDLEVEVITAPPAEAT